MDYCAELRRHRQSISEAALFIAREFEAGRAHSPFQERFTTLSLVETSRPVRAGILAASPEVAHALLADFLGPDYNVCKVVVPSRLGYSEVILQERGFLLDSGDGPQEFDDVGAFIDALKATHSLESAPGMDLEPIRLKLKGPAHLSGLCLLIPHSLEALHRKPALLSTLADQADWIFLAGSSSTRISTDLRDTIQLALDHVTGMQNVLVAAGDEPVAPNTEEWWKGWKVTLSLGFVRQGSDLLRSRLSLLTAPQSDLRRYLVESRLCAELEMALTLMLEETQQAQRQLTTRLVLAKEGLAPGGAVPDSRKAAESIRTRLAEECESLGRMAERDAKIQLGPDGELCRRLRAASGQITIDDIDQAVGEEAIRLTLAEHVTHGFNELIAGAARDRLRSDLEQLREGIECSVRDAEKALEATTGVRHKLNFALPDEDEMHAAMGAVSRPEIRYRSEMPRPTFATRFNAARQTIMSLMIIGTVLGGTAALTGESGANSSIRTTLYALMLPLLIVGFVWTYVSFRKKERLTLEKEVDQLHEGVYVELRRVIGEVLREQHAALSQHLQKTLRALQQQTDVVFAQTEQQRARVVEQQRKRGAEQLRSIEQRVNALRDFHRPLTALQARLADARKIQTAWLNAWIERFNQGKL
jgi:hypothetical protein